MCTKNIRKIDLFVINFFNISHIHQNLLFQLEETKHVEVQPRPGNMGGATKVRTLTITDSKEDNVKVFLWRDATQVKLALNDEILLKDVKVYWLEFYRIKCVTCSYPDVIEVFYGLF